MTREEAQKQVEEILYDLQIRNSDMRESIVKRRRMVYTKRVIRLIDQVRQEGLV